MCGEEEGSYGVICIHIIFMRYRTDTNYVFICVFVGAYIQLQALTVIAQQQVMRFLRLKVGSC